MASMARRLSTLLVSKLDLAFTLGRVFALLPVLIMSRLISDTDVLAEQVSAYQVAMFLATLVLYGAPQVYLVKTGIEQRVFVYHMALSAALVATVLALMAPLGWTAQLLLPFLFLVIFRSYYLLFASYQKHVAGPSFALVGIALVTLAVFALTLSYLISGLVCLALMVALAVRLGYGQLRYACVAGRAYVAILRRNSGYFVTFLLQQTYTQITLAVYALFAVGEVYLLATHIVYIYAVSFLFHGVLFRYYLSKMSRERFAGTTRKNLRRSLVLSLLLGLLSAGAVVMFYEAIETLLFSRSYMNYATAVTLAVMILLNSANTGWSALFLSQKRPYQLAMIATISTCVVIGGIVLAGVFDVANGLIWAMLIGLAMQAVLRFVLGLRLLAKTEA